MLEKSMNQEPNLINQESLLIYLGEDVKAKYTAARLVKTQSNIPKTAMIIQIHRFDCLTLMF
jgi:hypothetical protein